MERFRVFRVFRGSLRPIREIRELRGQFSVPPPLRPSALRLLTSAFQHFSISAFLFPRPISEIREIRGQFSVPQSRSPAFQPFSLSAFLRPLHRLPTPKTAANNPNATFVGSGTAVMSRLQLTSEFSIPGLVSAKNSVQVLLGS